MSEMIERMAKALYDDWVKEDFTEDYCAWDLLPGKDMWRQRARATLAAMQEPTDKMIDAVYDPAVNSRSSVANDWRSMVEAELGEGG
jgi:hypothetical protein